MSLKTKGFAFVEVIFYAAIFLIVTVGVYQAYIALNRSTTLTEQKLFSLEIANDKLERARTVPYESLASSAETKNLNGFAFNINTTVTTTTSPFNSKLIEVRVSCVSCKNFSDVLVTGRVAP